MYPISVILVEFVLQSIFFMLIILFFESATLIHLMFDVFQEKTIDSVRCHIALEDTIDDDTEEGQKF